MSASALRSAISSHTAPRPGSTVATCRSRPERTAGVRWASRAHRPRSARPWRPGRARVGAKRGAHRPPAIGGNRHAPGRRSRRRADPLATATELVPARFRAATVDPQCLLQCVRRRSPGIAGDGTVMASPGRYRAGLCVSSGAQRIDSSRSRPRCDRLGSRQSKLFREYDPK